MRIGGPIGGSYHIGVSVTKKFILTTLTLQTGAPPQEGGPGGVPGGLPAPPPPPVPVPFPPGSPWLLGAAGTPQHPPSASSISLVSSRRPGSGWPFEITSALPLH